MEHPLRSLQLDALEPLTLTFGLELEFILRFNPANYTLNRNGIDDWFSSLEEAARDHVISVFKGSGYAVYGEDEHLSPPGPPFEKWDLGKDSSIHVSELSPPPERDRFGYCEIELRSPALSYTTASLLQIKRVLRLLFSTFDILVNRSCGLHVHVGNELKEFPLQTLKNLCIITTTFERELESLHPPSRIGNEYSQSSGALFEGTSPWDVEKLIKSTHSLNDLISRMQNGKKGYAYNLLNLGGGNETIEFRQHEATVNVADIIKWVELSCSLVEKAHGFAMEDRYDLHQNAPRRYHHLDGYLDATFFLPNRSILDVLTHLSLDNLAKHYSARGLYTHARPAWAWADPCLEDTMTPWIESAHRSEYSYMDSEDIDSSLGREYIDGEEIIKSVANSKQNRERYWNAVLNCASNTAISIPCEHDGAIEREEGSWECFCDHWDCRSRAESWTTASAGSVWEVV